MSFSQKVDGSRIMGPRPSLKVPDFWAGSKAKLHHHSLKGSAAGLTCLSIAKATETSLQLGMIPG